MKRLISTINLSKEDWLRYRKCGITGTDAGAILGLNPYRSAFQVYHDKISDTIENIDNEAMRQGRDLEDYVAQRFSEATGLKVRRANAIYQSEAHPLLLADFDRLIVGQKAGLECKTVSPFSADKWADGKIPAHYLAQVDHYLAVSGFDCWYIAALIFGKELVIHKIIRDKAVLDDLIAKEEHFWKYNVMPEIPPAPTGSEGDDFKKAGAEVVNEKNIRKYLDYLVNDNGWTKSGGLIPTYTSPCGKKGCYADWERRIYAEYNKKKLSSTEITAFFEQFQ